MLATTFHYAATRRITEVCLLVALVGGLVIALGSSRRTWVGLGGLLIAVGLAEAFTRLAHLAGTASEEALYLSSATRISLQGLLLAGMVIGAVGDLNRGELAAFVDRVFGGLPIGSGAIDVAETRPPEGGACLSDDRSVS